MDSPKFQTLTYSGTPTPFPPRPRSHLKSRTFNTLVRILPVCFHESLRPNATEIAQDHPNQDNESKESGQETVIEMRDALAAFDSAEPENSLIQKDPLVDDNFEAICLQDAGVSEALSALENELVDAIGIKGNEDLVPGNSTISPTSSPHNMENGNGNVLQDDKNVCFDFQQALSVGDGNAGEMQVGTENQSCEASEAVDTSLEEDMITAVSKLGDTGQGKGSSSERNTVGEAQHDMQPKAAEIEKSVCSTGTIDSSPCMTAEGDTEEGEISGSDVSIDLALEEKVGEEQSSKDKGLMNSFNEQKRAEDLKESNRKMIKYDYDMVFHEETDIEGIASTKKDAGVCNKKKRGILSDERKEKRKIKKKMKRAEKNRKLGVKRLKLQPIPAPKTVKYCRHYLNGRCHKGDECNFSHDTVPLTKSKPCCHFVRQACMKGEDCPFDHQLSKYPCNNYVSKGSCSRGDNCMFSHKVPLQEGSPTVSSACKADVQSSSSLVTSDSKKQLDNTNNAPRQNVKASSAPNRVFPWKNTQQNLAGNVLKQPAQASTQQNLPENVLKPRAQAPKGINFLSFGKSAADSSGKLKEAGSSLNKDVNATIGYQTSQTAVGISQIMNEILRTSPATAPKGINFLSFGKDPLASEPSNEGNNSTQAGDLDKCKPGSSPLKREDGAKVGNQASVSAPTAVQNIHEVPERSVPSVTVAGMNFLSVGKAPMDESTDKKQASLPSRMDSDSGTCIEGRKSTSDKLQKTGTMPWRLPGSPFVLGQSSDRSAEELNKSKLRSVPKALMSTLAFAAKFDPGIRVNRPASVAAIDTEINKYPKDSSSTRSSQNNESMKASTILDFLYSVGSEAKK